MICDMRVVKRLWVILPCGSDDDVADIYVEWQADDVVDRVGDIAARRRMGEHREGLADVTGEGKNLCLHGEIFLQGIICLCNICFRCASSHYCRFESVSHRIPAGSVEGNP